MANFFSTGGSQTQTTTLPDPGMEERSLYNQLFGLSGQQTASIGQQSDLYRALMNPHQSLQILNTADPRSGAGGQTDQAMRARFGNDFMDRFMAGGGTGKGLTPEEFNAYQQASREFSHSGLRDIDSQDLRMKLQQQIAQNQAGQQAQAQQLTRLQNPYGLSSEEQAGINDVYGAAQNRAMNDLNLQFQDLVTSRGLNRFDTPAAEPLARNMGVMLGDLNAQRSAALLNRGEANRNFGMQQVLQNANLGQMQFNQGNMINQMTPGANTALLQPLLQSRMAQATTKGTSTQTPSMFDTIMRGAGAAGGMGQAARFLARHYSMMAASVFPVIEIDAQREVDFIVGTGRELVDYFL
jgi:hypothetical protein